MSVIHLGLKYAKSQTWQHLLICDLSYPEHGCLTVKYLHSKFNRCCYEIGSDIVE